MRGDFSRRDDEQKTKYSAVLHQQGRVLLDSDWNDQVALQEYWKDILSRDVIGEDVVAVAASQKDSFEISEITANKKIKLKAGRAWVNGLLLHNTQSDIDHELKTFEGYTASDREAVILRAWQQEVSAFQDEDLLLEKALGGVDTTARVENVFELYKIPAGDMSCEEIRQQVSDLPIDDEEQKIKLNVRFQPTQESSVDGDDCPAVQVGGYRGLEHCLYRIEMENVLQDENGPVDSKNNPFFKWSHINGGMVGRGHVQSLNGDNYLIPTQNASAIFQSGFERFERCYVEFYEFDKTLKKWTSTFGAVVKFLDQDRKLKIEQSYRGNIPTPDKNIFFRVWSGIRPAKDFESGWIELRDGIQLQFTNLADGKYLAGEYWTFEARANNPAGEPRNFKGGASAPHGPTYQNACLGIIDWNDDSPYHDCRKIFDPLVDIDHGCCIEVSETEDLVTAVRQVKDAGGGCICLLPGTHIIRDVLDFSDTKGVLFKGLGGNCVLQLAEDYAQDSVFILNNTTESRFHGFTLEVKGASLKNIWEAPSAFKVSICDTQIYCPYEAREEAEDHIAVFNGGLINGLELKSNIWLSWKSLTVTFLTDALIERNWFLFGDNALFAVAALAVQIHHNRMMVLSFDIQKLPYVEAMTFHRSDRIRKEGLILSALQSAGYWVATENSQKLRVFVMSNAIQFAVAAQMEVSRNLISAARGIQTILALDYTVSENRFVSTLYATQSLIWSQGAQIRDNTVSGPNSKAVTVGFHFAARASDIRVLNNVVEESREGVVFDISGPSALLKQAKLTARRYELFEDEKSAKVIEERILKESQQELKEALEFLMRQSKGIKVNTDVAGGVSPGIISDLGEKMDILFKTKNLPPAMMLVENIRIEGNRFKSTWTGVEIAGERSVANYNISNNLISHCENVAIFLPGESNDLQTESAKIVDLRKSVSNNKILCQGVAIWSWQNEIRVESNDIRVYPSSWNAMTWFKSIFELAEEWPQISEILEEESEEDLEDPKVILKLARILRKIAIRGNLNSVLGKDTAWSEQFEYLTNAGRDALTEEAKDLLSIKIIQLMVASIRGFAVGVWGISSVVRLNKIDVETTTLPGGLVVGSLSGEISENEITAQRMGMLLAEDARALKSPHRKKEKILYTPIQITSNRVICRGALEDDKEQSSFSLLIPRILRGDLSVSGNHFVGDVHIGQDLEIDSDRGTLTAMDMAVINKSVKANTLKALMVKRTRKAVTKKVKKPSSSRPDKGSDFPHPKILFCQNQTFGGAVSILPFGFKMIGAAKKNKEDVILIPSEDDQLPMVTFTSNQLDSGDKASFIFGYQVVISGNQSLIDKNQANEKYKLVGMAYNKANIYAVGNMPEATALQHE